jgi:hypothetical protein
MNLRRHRVWFDRRIRRRGILLTECLVYMSVWIIVTGLAFVFFYHALTSAKRLQRNAEQITQALKAGERWREDVRRAVAPLTLAQDSGSTDQALHIQQKDGEIVYYFAETNVFRASAMGVPWQAVLPKVKASRMSREQRKHVAVWRWEIELQTRRGDPVMRPLFTFIAVAAADSSP